MNLKKYLLIVCGVVVFIFTVSGGVLTARFMIGPITSDSGNISREELDPKDMAIKNKVNILVMGTDYGQSRTDVMMLVCLDPRNAKVNILSIPRDTRVKIGAKYQKINAAYALNGEKLAIQTVKEVTGLPVHHYVVFSFKGFRDAVDALGGVEFDVPCRMKKPGLEEGLNIDLQAGRQRLDGNKAEQLVRFRDYLEGDVQRVRTQQAFLTSLVEQKLNLWYIGKIPDLLSAVNENVKTDLSAMEIASYAITAKDYPREDIRFFMLPGEPRDRQQGYDASYYIYFPKDIKTLVETEFGY